MKAMILAAGRGERMMPLTKTTPKPLLKVRGLTLIEHSIMALKKAKISNIIVNVAYLGWQIKAYIGNGSRLGVKITYSDEFSGALDTAGGIIKALPLLGKEPFVVINSDVLCDYDLSKLALPVDSLAHLILVDNPEHNTTGDFSLTDDHQGSINQSNDLTFSGIGIYHPNFFKPYTSTPGQLALYPLLKDAIANNKLSAEHYHGHWQDIGTPERLEQANFR